MSTKAPTTGKRSVAAHKPAEPKPHRRPAESSGSRGSYSRILDLQRNTGNRAVGGLLHGGEAGAVRNDPPPFPVRADEVTGRLGAGEPLPGEVQGQLRQQFTQDFSQVRVHDDPQADYVAGALGAEALAVGNHIAFRRGRYDPGSPRGRALIAHEAEHIAAGSRKGGSQSSQPVQLAITMDDLAPEMVGTLFRMRTTQGSPPNEIPAGTFVTIVDWGAGNTARIERRTMGVSTVLDVPKLALEPVHRGAVGVRQYNVGLASQQQSVQRGQAGVEEQRAVVAGWKAQEADHSATHDQWAASLGKLEVEAKRREGLQANRENLLNQMLVRETMYNRFDYHIAHWVEHYNTTLHPATKLNPNVVKSMLFEESGMGTQGVHLQPQPYSWADPVRNPIHSRFNIGQAIDSAGPQQLIMIKEMAPKIFEDYKLADLEAETRARIMSESDYVAWRNGDFKMAVMEFFSARDQWDRNLMGNTGKDLGEDYEFWIRTAVRWLFYKYLSLPTPDWAEAVRAYNGSGLKAQNYKARVMGRAGRSTPLNVGNS
jgi:Domain of unknown function (DUF4157)